MLVCACIVEFSIEWMLILPNEAEELLIFLMSFSLVTNSMEGDNLTAILTDYSPPQQQQQQQQQERLNLPIGVPAIMHIPAPEPEPKPSHKPKAPVVNASFPYPIPDPNQWLVPPDNATFDICK